MLSTGQTQLEQASIPKSSGQTPVAQCCDCWSLRIGLTFICPHPLAWLKQPCVAGLIQSPLHPVAIVNSSLFFPRIREGKALCALTQRERKISFQRQKREGIRSTCCKTWRPRSLLVIDSYMGLPKIFLLIWCTWDKLSVRVSVLLKCSTSALLK